MADGVVEVVVTGEHDEVVDGDRRRRQVELDGEVTVARADERGVGLRRVDAQRGGGGELTLLGGRTVGRRALRRIGRWCRYFVRHGVGRQRCSRQGVGRQAPRRQGVTELVEIGRRRVGSGQGVVVTVERTAQPGDPDDGDQGDGDPQRDAQAIALHLVGPGLADHRLLLERSVGFLTFTLLGTHERGRLSAAASAMAALKRSGDIADDDSFGLGGIGASGRVRWRMAYMGRPLGCMLSHSAPSHGRRGSPDGSPAPARIRSGPSSTRPRCSAWSRASLSPS